MLVSSLLVIMGLIWGGICLFWCVLLIDLEVLKLCKVFLCWVEFYVVCLLLVYGIGMILVVVLLMCYIDVIVV